jgi:hypothetical protein
MAIVIYKSKCDCFDDKSMVYKDFFTKVVRLVTKGDATSLDFTKVSATGFISAISFLLTAVVRELSAATLSSLMVSWECTLPRFYAKNCTQQPFRISKWHGIEDEIAHLYRSMQSPLRPLLRYLQSQLLL